MSVSVLLLPWITPAGAGKTVFERAPPEILLRITPAGAGKTRLKSIRLNRNGDHPRRCGENLLPASVERQPMGSPPQVRGKREFSVDTTGKKRITPAGAGKTFSG